MYILLFYTLILVSDYGRKLWIYAARWNGVYVGYVILLLLCRVPVYMIQNFLDNFV